MSGRRTPDPHLVVLTCDAKYSVSTSLSALIKHGHPEGEANVVLEIPFYTGIYVPVDLYNYILHTSTHLQTQQSCQTHTQNPPVPSAQSHQITHPAHHHNVHRNLQTRNQQQARHSSSCRLSIS